MNFPISFIITLDGKLLSRHSVRDEAEKLAVLEATKRVYPSAIIQKEPVHTPYMILSAKYQNERVFLEVSDFDAFIAAAPDNTVFVQDSDGNYIAAVNKSELHGFQVENIGGLTIVNR